jgi:hypothetical protein
MGNRFVTVPVFPQSPNINNNHANRITLMAQYSDPLKFSRDSCVKFIGET